MSEKEHFLNKDGLSYYDAVQKQRFKEVKNEISSEGSLSMYIKITCTSEYEGKTFTATSELDQSTYTAQEENGQALIHVKMPGSYTISNDLNENTETVTVGDILMAEADFSVFKATINVTIPESLIGQTITCTQESKVYKEKATATQVTFNVNKEGNWIIAVEGNTYVKSATVNVLADKGTYSGTLTVDEGSTPMIVLTSKEEDNGKTFKCSKDETVLTQVLKNKTCTFVLPSIGEWTITCDDIPETQKKVNVAETKVYHAFFRASIFGIKVTQSESDPKQRIVVDTSGDLNGLTPVTVNTQDGTVNYGDMEDTFLFKALNHVVLKSIDKSEEIELNPNDYTQRLEGGSAPSASLTSNYNVFARADKLYIYEYSASGYEYFFISDEKIDNKYEPIGFYNATGENDYAYLGCYGGSFDSQSRLRSVSGERLKNDTSYTDFKTAATKTGSDYYMDTHAHINLYEVAYLMLIQNDDSQTAVGKGRDYNAGGTSNDTSQKLMGISSGWADKKGPIAMDPATGAIKFMHIEDLWGGSLYFWEEGITFKNGKTYVRMRPPYPATTDSSGTSTYTEVTGAYSGSGNISESVVDNKWGRIPSACSGSTSTYQCDSWNSGSGDTQYACRRGCYGLWFRNFTTFSYTNSSRGARLSLIPS